MSHHVDLDSVKTAVTQDPKALQALRGYAKRLGEHVEEVARHVDVLKQQGGAVKGHADVEIALAKLRGHVGSLVDATPAIPAHPKPTVPVLPTSELYPHGEINVPYTMDELVARHSSGSIGHSNPHYGDGEHSVEPKDVAHPAPGTGLNPSPAGHTAQVLEEEHEDKKHSKAKK